jgi:hypothetical protein
MHGEEALVVTCGHIFRDTNGKGRIEVDVGAGLRPRTVEGTLISFDLERDIGLVAIMPGTVVTPIRVASPSFRVERGQTVFSVGCDKGADPTVRPSTITGIDRYLGPPNVQVAGMPVDGRSGGGLFSSDGMIIGICNAADPQDQEGIFASLPVIHWELDKIGQRALYDRRERGPTIAATNVPPAAASLPAGTKTLPAAQPTPVSKQPAPTGVLPRDMPGTSVAIAPHSAGPLVDDTEVICIVRSRVNPSGTERLLVLDRPSRDLLDRLASESQPQPLAMTRGVMAPITPGPMAPGSQSPQSPSGQVIRAQSAGR